MTCPQSQGCTVMEERLASSFTLNSMPLQRTCISTHEMACFFQVTNVL